MPTYFNLAEPQFRIPGGAGYKVYAYQIGGTTTPISTYSAYTGGANAWPVVLSDDGNGDGVASIFVTQDSTIKLTDSSDTTITGYPRSYVVPASVANLGALDTSTDGRLDAVESDILSLQSDVAAIVVPSTLVCSVSMQNSYRQTITVNNSATKITHFNVVESNSYELWSTADNWFMPSTEGWWNVTVCLSYEFNYPNNEGIRLFTRLYKNGSVYRTVYTKNVHADDGEALTVSSNTNVYLNGSTDYLEIYTRDVGGSGTYYIGSTSSGVNATNCYFQAHYIGPGYSA